MSTITERTRVTVTGHIRLLSGLHVGAGRDAVEIGGVDNPVIKHPHTGEPYIPGSSIKGKLRSLLEWGFGNLRQDGQPWGAQDTAENAGTPDPADPVLRIFGNALKAWRAGPTRLVLRDAAIDGKWRDEILGDGLPLTEEKTEVVIDRISGKAGRAGTRQTERVPAGALFDFAMAFRIFDTGDGGARDVACLNWVLQGLDLLEQDALGGSGSRGYGRIRFENLTLTPLGDAAVPLDNRFRGHPFRREAPAEIWAPA